MIQAASVLSGVPLVESPFFEELFVSPNFDDRTIAVARDLHEKGFAVIEFPAIGLRSDADLLVEELATQYADPVRIQDAWRFNERVRKLAVNAEITQLLSRIYGRRAIPFQTLNFRKGTEQHFHSDSVHFSSAPERFMCGVWIAFEDIDTDNGPLVYYPGSHKLPIYYHDQIGAWNSTRAGYDSYPEYERLWRELVRVNKFEPFYFYAKKGQALIWASNLLHGGSKVNDPARSRHSQVTHYYFENCAYFTPILSDPFYGKVQFRSITDISTDQVIQNQYLGQPIPGEFIERVTPRG